MAVFFDGYGVMPTSLESRVEYRFSYAEPPDVFEGPHHFRKADPSSGIVNWTVETFPDGTVPADEEWWNIYPDEPVQFYRSLAAGLEHLRWKRCMVSTIAIMGVQADFNLYDSPRYWMQKAMIATENPSGPSYEQASEQLGEFESDIRKVTGESPDHWDDTLGSVLTEYLLLIDDYMTAATGRALPENAGIDTLVAIMKERFYELDAYGPLNWQSDPALWQDNDHIRGELEQLRIRIGPDDAVFASAEDGRNRYSDFYRFMTRCAGAYQTKVWDEYDAWGLRSPMTDLITVGETYQGFTIFMQGRFRNSRHQEVAWYRTDQAQIVFLNYLIQPDTDPTVLSWRQELGRLEPGDVVFSILDDTPHPVIIENIEDNVAGINFSGESIEYPLPLLQKLPDGTAVGSEPPVPYEPFVGLSANDDVTVTGYDDGAVTSFKGQVIGVIAGELERQYAVYVPHADLVNVYWVPRSLLEWLKPPTPPPSKGFNFADPTYETIEGQMNKYTTPALGLGVLVLFGLVLALD